MFTSSKIDVPEAPVVLIHPWGSSGEMCWTNVANRLREAGHEVSIVDLPGHASAGSVPFTWNNAAERVIAASTAADAGPAVLVGLSVGAAVALRAAARTPEAVAGIVLTGAGACWADRRTRAVLSAVSIAGFASAAAGRYELLAYASGYRGLAQLHQAGESMRGSSPVQLYRTARELTKFDVRSVPPPQVPAAVLVLADDHRMPPGLQRRLARYLDCPSFDIAADHDAPVREPERFTGALIEALAAVGSARPASPTPAGKD